MKRKSIFNSLLVLILAVVAFLVAPAPAEAQIGNGRLYSFDVDTLTNTDTLIFTFVKELDEEYNYTWQIFADSLTGTTSVTAYLQERLKGETQWVNVDTVSFTTDTRQFISGSNVGNEQRLWVRSSGTQSTSIKPAVWYRRKRY